MEKAAKSLYHLSEQDLDGKTIQPRIPSNFLISNGYEDKTTKRVCFTPSVDKCLRAMSSNIKGKKFNVYIADGNPKIIKPTVKQVPDVKVTGEIWVTEPVKLKYVGKIEVLHDSGEDGLKYTYGKYEAELYDWDYKWIDKAKTVVKESINENKNKSLSDYKLYKVDQSFIDKYKSNNSIISKLNFNPDSEGKPETMCWMDNDKVVGIITVDTIPAIDGYRWFGDFEVDKKYRQLGLGTQILKYAINVKKAGALAVRKDNKVAYELYKKNGFKEDSNRHSDTYYYMYLSRNIYKSYVKESYVFNEPNIEFNIDQWAPGNPLWITGSSGDGKSTYAKKLAKKYDAIIVEGDTILVRTYLWSKEKWLKKGNTIFGHDTISMEYIKLYPELPYGTGVGTYSSDPSRMIDYFEWVYYQAKNNPKYNKRYIIIESCDICHTDPKIMSKRPLIIMGTSRLNSFIRRVKRDVVERDSNIISSIFTYIKQYPVMHKQLDDIKDEFSHDIDQEMRESYVKESFDFTKDKITTPKDIYNWMHRNIKYRHFNKIQTTKETVEKGTGDCHDQSLLIASMLKKINYNPKFLCMIEYYAWNQPGGATHSCCYYEDNNKIYWIENAWEQQAGIHGPYNSLKELENDIASKWTWSGKNDKLYIKSGGKVMPGDTLNDWADKNTPEDPPTDFYSRYKNLSESAIKYINDEGKSVPKICTECGSEVKVFMRGEPVFLCSNERCRKYFGVVPFKEAYSLNMTNDLYPVYIVLFSNDTDFGKLIRKATGSEYSHATIMLDSSMNNMYSFSDIPYSKDSIFGAGFVRESIWSPMYKKNRYFTILVTFVTKEERDIIQSKINYFCENHTKFKYNDIGLVQYYLNFKETKGHSEEKKKFWFCSEFVSYMCKSANVNGFTDIMLAPQDIKNVQNPNVINLGDYTIPKFKESDLIRKTEEARKIFINNQTIPVTESFHFDYIDVVKEFSIKDFIKIRKKEFKESEVIEYTALIDWKYLYDEFTKLFPDTDPNVRFDIYELIVRKLLIPFKRKAEYTTQEIYNEVKNIYKIIGRSIIKSVDTVKGLIYVEDYKDHHSICYQYPIMSVAKEADCNIEELKLL